jgi:hypothetical protein
MDSLGEVVTLSDILGAKDMLGDEVFGSLLVDGLSLVIEGNFDGELLPTLITGAVGLEVIEGASEFCMNG